MGSDQNERFRKGLLGCAAFFAVVVGLGVVDAIWTRFETPALIVVSTAAFATALWHSGRGGPFDKAAVDAFYYSVGLIGVALVFQAQGAERYEHDRMVGVIDLLQEVEEARKTETQAIRTLSAIEAALALVAADRQAAVEALRRLMADDAGKLRPDESEACAEALGLTLTSEEPSGRDEDDMAAAMRRLAAEVACAAGQRRAARMRESVLDAPFDDARLREAVFGAAGEGDVTLPGGSAPAPMVAAALLDTLDREQAAEIVSGALLRRSAAETAFADRMAEISGATARRRLSAARTPAAVVLFVWPYGLAALLCLKLARPQ